MCLCTFRYREDKLNMDRQMVRMRNSDSYWTNIESRWGHDFVYYASANIRDKIIPFPRDWYKYLLKRWTDEYANDQEFLDKSWEIRDTDLFNAQLVYKGKIFGHVRYASGYWANCYTVLDEKAMIDTGLVRLTNEDKAKERIVRTLDDGFLPEYKEEVTLRRERKKKFADVLDELSCLPPDPNTGFPGGEGYRLAEEDFNLRQNGLLVDSPGHGSDVTAAASAR